MLMTLAQVFMAVVLLAPEGSLSSRYSSLVQHDSWWFASIVDHGYETILPPIARKMMEVSNVAFFPNPTRKRGIRSKSFPRLHFGLGLTAKWRCPTKGFTPALV